jgi:hypothetical protein
MAEKFKRRKQQVPKMNVIVLKRSYDIPTTVNSKKKIPAINLYGHLRLIIMPMSKLSSLLCYTHIFCLVWLHVGTRDFEDEPEMWGSTA